MNNLSWMIYFAGVSDSLAFVLSFAFISLTIATIICFIVYGISHDQSFSDQPNLGAKQMGFNCVIALAAVGIIGSILPSKNTVYAIAASEMGEQALSTPTAGKAFKALDAWLDRQISGKEEKE